MKVLYFDLVGGAAGDMLLGALVDAGASLDAVRAAVTALGVQVELRERTVYPAGLRARKVDVVLGGDGHAPVDDDGHDHDHVHVHDHGAVGHRPYRVIRDMIGASTLAAGPKAIALDAFHRLALAEASAHGVDPDDVEFHEVGSDDAIADIVGVAVAITDLAVDRIVVSPVPIARGLTRGAHGPIPLPGPAALSLLEGAPLQQTPLRGETITPTGAALLAALCDEWGPIPSMTLRKVGVGAGDRAWPDRPNVVRAMIGDAAEADGLESAEDLVIETNIDDMTAEHLAILQDRLLDAGAIDVWSHDVSMKKGRQGRVVSALCRATAAGAVTRAFFVHSTTLGVRTHAVRRTRTERHVETVATEFGDVRVKVAQRPDGPSIAAPELDDCEALARDKGTSVRAVHEAAQRAFWARNPG